MTENPNNGVSYSIKDAKLLVRHLFRRDHPVLLSGPPGVGKSALWKQIADEEGVPLIDVRLTTKDVTDLTGLPRDAVVKEDGKDVPITTWSRPDFLPRVDRDGPKGILLIDEISDASRPMQSATYELILDRRIGPHKLPDGWYPCGAGNRRQDFAAANTLSSALANRFAHIQVHQDAKAFGEYAAEKHLNMYVAPFIRAFPHLLFNLERMDQRAFPTPRTWERVAEVCDDFPKLGDPTGMREKLIAAWVGEGPASEFEAFLNTMDLPELDEVLGNPMKCRIPPEPSHLFALCSMLSRNATTTNFSKLYQYVSRDNFGKDFMVCFMLDATSFKPALMATKTFQNFLVENKDIHV